MKTKHILLHVDPPDVGLYPSWDRPCSLRTPVIEINNTLQVLHT